MGTLRATTNYIWDIKEELGKGATSFVYLGRDKRTGKKCAVKTFTTNSRLNPVLLKREISVFSKLKHRNVVELIATEPELSTKFDVVIMELCPSGSLLDVLRKPENCFGLPETEMLHLLADLASGMEYFKEIQVTHRDIKPGNIMRCTDTDGSYIYKLADFGTAKDLKDNEAFVSLVGTPEYLHPDMYARAFINERQQRFFTNKVDLWSIGVTLYHAAAGELPFQPFRGRDGTQVMYNMTTRKESGVISGIECSPGKVVWSSTLPETCELSTGLQNLLVPIIAGLEECDVDKMWDFDKFFQKVKDVMNRTIVHIFDVVNWQSIQLFLPPSTRLNAMLPEITKQTGYDTSDGILLHHGELLSIGTTSPKTVETLRPTCPSDPILMWCTPVPEGPSVLTIPGFLQSRRLPGFRSLGQDVDAARDINAVSCSVKRRLADYSCQMVLVDKAAAMLRSILKAQSDELRDRIMLLDALLQSTIKRAGDLDNIHEVVQTYIDSHSSSLPEDLNARLRTLQTNIEALRVEMDRLDSKDFQKAVQFHKEKDFMSIPWGCDWVNPCRNPSTWAGEAATQDSEINEIFESFRALFRKTEIPPARYGKSDQQIHSFERLSLERLFKNVEETLRSCLDDGVGPLVAQSRQFYRGTQKANLELKQQHELCATHRERVKNADTQMDSVSSQCLAVLREALECIRSTEEDFAVVAAPESLQSQKKSEELARTMLTRLAGLLKEMSVTKQQVHQSNTDMRNRMAEPSFSMPDIPRRAPGQGGAMDSMLMSMHPRVYEEREKERQRLAENSK